MSNPYSRVMVVGVNCCDGYPRCQFESKDRRELRDHKRQCLHSDAGAFYRVFRGHGPNREGRGL